METISVGILCSLAGLLISYIVMTRNKAKDDRNDGRQSGQILSEIGYVKSGIDDIKTEQREQRKINTEMYSRMSAVEASAKQAHKRLDRMEGREDREHESH